MRAISYILILFVTFFSGIIHAQQDVSFDSENSLNEIRKEVNFDKTRWSLMPRSSGQSNKTSSQSSKRSSSGLGLSNYLIIIIVLVLILALSFLLIPKTKTKEATSDSGDQDIEEELEDIDAVTILNQALNDGDYRLAIRMKFILALQELQTRKLIKWTPEKTNLNYYSELKESPIAPQFRKASRIYEWVWYGQRNITQAQYVNMVDPLNSLNNQLNE